MKFLRQMVLIFGFSLLGELLHWLIPWPIPASIYGMVLLFLALFTGAVKLEQVKGAGEFLSSLLPILFVAPIVNLLDCWDLIREDLVGIVAAMLVSTVLCFAVSGWITQLLMKKGGKDRD